MFAGMPRVEQLERELMDTNDIMAFAVLAALRRVEHDLNRMGWEQDGRLFTIYRQMVDDSLPEGTSGFMLAVTEVGTKLLAGCDGDAVSTRLHKLANSPMLARMVPSNVFGFVVANEAWSSVVPTRELPGYERGDVTADPRHIEIRFLQAVDRAGIVYMLMRRRDNNEVYAALVEKQDQAYGQVTDALRALTEACT